MELEVFRYSTTPESTLGLLHRQRLDVWDGPAIADRGSKLLAYTLEDTARSLKIAGETRIPAGRYRVTLRTEGGHHERYKARYEAAHKGMLWVRDVPGFEWILVHCGNDADDTAGCLLVGDMPSPCSRPLRQYVSASRKRYEAIYPELAAFAGREDLWITYTDHG